MNLVRVAGAILLILGILGLVYGGFSYTKETHDAELGPLEIEIKDRERVNVPVWAGVAAILVGGGLLAYGLRRGSPGR